MSRSWSSTELCAAAHISYRQLDYWTRTGAVTPSLDEGDGSGTRRGWSTLDVARVAAIAEVARDLDALGLDLSVELVADLWSRLGGTADTVVCSGTVTISASRPTV